MYVAEIPELDEIFESAPVVDHAMTVEDRHQRKPTGSADQGYRED